ncbi:MAG: ATP-binding protein [Candidatus Omnitrophica bacterium]|nr:ATP-binding protein [Candidatus Omnitrophota bacterium]MDD5487875.1 ATP-binding protein [Candidatus Omnitrophota bacterium]
MKQVVVISGKGGTGKTVITASFAAIARSKVMVDCDVDAADLHLLLDPATRQNGMFKSGKTAEINPEKCVKCGLCRGICRFRAVTADFKVDPISCEGCAFCSFICPEKAIEMKENVTGEWFVSDTRFGPMVHARLGIAEENSGKLVSLVKGKAKEIAEKDGHEWVIVDGSPGIGCPVIASLSGANAAIVVTEPTLSGLHDAKRVVAMARHFNVPVMFIINKYDLNERMADDIRAYCCGEKIDVIARIGFDEDVVKAMVEGKTIIEYAENVTTRAIREAWEAVTSIGAG